MDVDGQTSQQRNTEADTEEEHIEAQAQAEMHELRNMVPFYEVLTFLLTL